MKKVSIIIPTYKRPDALPRAITSALNQTYGRIEVIVVDDNPPDSSYRADTEKNMQSFLANEKVRYIQHDKNRNGSAARNTGFRASSGDYICFLDDDDEYLPGKIAAQVEKLDSLGDEWGCCYCNYVIKKNGKIRFRSVERKEGNIYFEELCRNFFHGGGTGPMIRRSVYEAVGGFDESFHRNQDIEFMLKISKKYQVAHVSIIGYIGYEDEYRESVVSYEQVLQHYEETFQSEIDDLTDTQRKKFYQIIALQSFKYYLGKKDFKKAKQALKDGNVHRIMLLRYMVHLMYRGLFKVGSSFKG